MSARRVTTVTVPVQAAPGWRVLVLLLGYTGLRWGEATALRVRDIDLNRRRIDVRRAFSECRRTHRPGHSEIAPVPHRPDPPVPGSRDRSDRAGQGT